MSLFFDDASSDYLFGTDTCGISDYPFTMSAWVCPDDASNNSAIFGFGSSTGSAYQVIQNESLTARATSDGGIASTSTTMVVNTWNNVCGVFSSATSRSIYINGGGKGTNATSKAWNAILNRTLIGAGLTVTPWGYFSGKISDVALWNVALTDGEVLGLGSGVNPLCVRPASLVAYWPLWPHATGGFEYSLGSPSYKMTDYSGGAGSSGPPVAPFSQLFYSPPLIESDVISGTVCWGHATPGEISETNIRTFASHWAGTGTIEGAGDPETIVLDTDEYMISEVVGTGSTYIELLQNEYAPGDTVLMQYRHGATIGNCESAAWNDYVSKFNSLGFVQVRIESTL